MRWAGERAVETAISELRGRGAAGAVGARCVCAGAIPDDAPARPGDALVCEISASYWEYRRAELRSLAYHRRLRDR